MVPYNGHPLASSLSLWICFLFVLILSHYTSYSCGKTKTSVIHRIDFVVKSFLVMLGLELFMGYFGRSIYIVITSSIISVISALICIGGMKIKRYRWTFAIIFLASIIRVITLYLTLWVHYAK